MERHKNSIASWNVDGLGGRSRKMVVRKWIKSLPNEPIILGLQELKTSSFFTTIALNTILPDYHRIVSLLDEGKGDTTSLYHPSLTLRNLGTLELGQIT